MADEPVARPAAAARRWRWTPATTVAALGVGLVGVAAVLVHVVWRLWPVVEAVAADEPGAVDPAVPDLVLFTLRSSPTPGQVYLALILTFGAVGSFIHAATSFTTFVGNRQFRLSWMWWYLLRPFVGAAVALVLVVAGLGGLLALGTDGAGADPRTFNPYTVAALAGLAGWFSKTAADKLEEVFEAVLANTKDRARADKLVDDLPVIGAVTVTPSATGARLTVSGSGFTDRSAVRVGGRARTTTLERDRLVVDLPLDDLPAGEAEIAVMDPSGRASEPIVLELPPAA
ncbi:MAG: hypothetical protein S0880_18615 [Actinomycetota bacterium]|nr:hypothetical protein [Actinomycetota bacterium]